MPGANCCRHSTRQPVGQGKGCVSSGGPPLSSSNQFSRFRITRVPSPTGAPPAPGGPQAGGGTGALEGRQEEVGGKQPFREAEPQQGQDEHGSGETLAPV